MIEQARKFKNEMIDKYPELEKDIIELYSLMLTEISDGSSPQNEYSLFVNSVKEIIIG